MASTILPNGKQQFIDINGNPLVAGTVGMYVPNSLVFKNTWQNAGQTILNTNPIVLDSRGQALIYGSGSYRQIVKDSLGNVIWDEPTASTFPASNAWVIPVGATSVVQNPSLQRISPEMYGAVHDGVTDDTTAINAAIAAALLLGASLYLVGKTDGSSVVIPYYVNGNVEFTVAGSSVLLVVGDGMNNSMIKVGASGSLTAGAGAYPVVGLTFRDWGVVASTAAAAAANFSGFNMGSSSAKYVGNFLAERWMCTGFAGTNSCGVKITSAYQWEFRDCVVTGNYYNLFRPNFATAAQGLATTGAITGEAGNWDLAVKNAFRIEGTIGGLRLDAGTARSCGNGAVYIGVPTVTNVQGYYRIGPSFYLENNNTSNSAVADIYVTGSSSSSLSSSILLDHVYFGTPAHSFSDAQLSADYAYLVAQNCLGLTSIKTTGNTLSTFMNNDRLGGGGGLRSVYEGLSGEVYAIDGPYDTSIPTYTVNNGITQTVAFGGSGYPTTGSWKKGAFVSAGSNMAVNGTPNLLIGWGRVTTGSGNVLGTDWIAAYCPAV